LIYQNMAPHGMLELGTLDVAESYVMIGHENRDDGKYGDGIRDALFARSVLDELVARALTETDPVAWLLQRVQAALVRLDAIDRPASVKEEAKRQLFNLERRLIRALGGGTVKHDRRRAAL
jgi:hypothetical protein